MLLLTEMKGREAVGHAMKRERAFVSIDLTFDISWVTVIGYNSIGCMHVQLVLASAVYGVKSLCVVCIHLWMHSSGYLLTKQFCVCVCVCWGCLTFALIHGFLAGVSYKI